MIRIPTDPTHLTTDCIGLPSHGKKYKARGRPKGSKSKTKCQRRTRKRRARECGSSNSESENNISIAPKRKKRKPNRSHREAFPDHTDEDIRRQLALERKAKNRKSAQESRERRKQQEHFLNSRLPGGLALKRLLISDNISADSIKTEESELNEMKMILDKMVDNNGNEYDEYANNKSIISDELIFNVLSEYLSPTKNEDIELETDHNKIHLQVIGEIENGIPMQVDDIPISATPMSFKAHRGRKKKKKKKKEKEVPVFATPPMMPQIISDIGIPPPVFGTETNDFNIDSESAVSLYPLHQDTMLTHYHFQSLYNVSNPQCIIKQENVWTEQTPSTISTNSTIMDSPTICAITPMIHTPEQMHFIHPLPAAVPHSPIIRVTPQEDMMETKQMLMHGMNGKSSVNGKSLKENHRILIQIIQSFITIMNGMEKDQKKINKAIEDLRIFVMDFMRQRLKIWMDIQCDIVQIYIPQIMQTIANHPLIPNTKTTDISLHYQIYRQIAMEIMQNMKQESIRYQRQYQKGEKEEEEEEEEMMISLDPAPIPAYIPMQSIMKPLDLNQDLNLNWIEDYHSLHQSMNMDPFNHLMQSKQSMN